MAVIVAMASGFTPPSSSALAQGKDSVNFGGGPDSLDVWGISSKSQSSSRAMQIEANAQVAPKINGTKILKVEGPKDRG